MIINKLLFTFAAANLMLKVARQKPSYHAGSADSSATTTTNASIRPCASPWPAGFHYGHFPYALRTPPLLHPSASAPL